MNKDSKLLILDQIPRVSLADIPTPLQEMPSLAAHLGLSKLLIKRDDETGLALGGNKARKLEYLMADAIRKGCDIVVTNGGPQSNHARMTAAAARKLGLDIKLVLAGPDFEQYQGNLLLDILFGADILFLKDMDVPEMDVEMARIADVLRADGHNPYLVPVGGSTGIGALGYVKGMQELSEQVGDMLVQIVLAVGSCGTMAGCVLGCSLFMPSAKVIGISVSRKAEPLKKRVAEIANEAAAIINTENRFLPGQIIAFDDYYAPAYGIPNEIGKEAIITTARLEGILLDPVYTGKGMAGLFDLARNGYLDPQLPVIFLHTGGTAALFAFEQDFRNIANCTKLLDYKRVL